MVSKRNMKLKRKTQNKKGGCNCGSVAMTGGAGGEDVVLGSSKPIMLPAGTAEPLNTYAHDMSNKPFIFSARDNMIKGGKKYKKNTTTRKTKGDVKCKVTQLVIMPVFVKPVKKTQKNGKNMKKGGSAYQYITNSAYDWLLGPSNSLTPVTSAGTLSGSVATSNSFAGRVGVTNNHPWSQPIGTKFTTTNLIRA